MTFTEVDAPRKIGIKLEFIKPFAATNQTTFTFEPAGENTKVVWAMDGQHNFVSKAMGLVMDMDKMVGPDFEKGLRQLKHVAERPAP